MPVRLKEFVRSLEQEFGVELSNFLPVVTTENQLLDEERPFLP